MTRKSERKWQSKNEKIEWRIKKDKRIKCQEKVGEERQTGEVGFGKEKRDKIVRKLGVAKVNIWCCRQKKLLRLYQHSCKTMHRMYRMGVQKNRQALTFLNV